MLFRMKWIASVLFTMLSTTSFGQMADFHFKRELSGVTAQWYKIVLPNEIFGKSENDLSDIRVFGLTPNADTIEAPYLLRLTKGEISGREISFNLLNTSSTSRGYYFTFKIPTEESINQIKLDFTQPNFDWQITLEGSQDLKEWFTVVEDYRILSIRNDFVDFKYTDLTFPASKYLYFRLFVRSNVKPALAAAKISYQEFKEGAFRDYRVNKMDIQENEKTKQTEVDIELDQPVPVSHLRVMVSDKLDYYRPVTIRYLVDSFHTEQGWKFNYRTLASGTLNSMGENEFDLGNTILSKLKIIISNRDNQPLKVANVEVKGYLHELQVRFAGEANYFLVYGNEKAIKPSYDIAHFTDKIPEAMTILTLGEEQEIGQREESASKPLFESKVWLWAVMVVIILLLGWFSLKMMRKGLYFV